MKLIGLDKMMLLLITCCLVGCAGCDSKFINPRISLWHQDKIPYGTWYAYNSLFTYFPEAEDIFIIKESPAVGIGGSSVDWEESTETNDSTVTEELQPELYLVVSPRFLPTDAEKEDLLRFVRKGNHLVIAAIEFDDSFLDSIGVQKVYGQPMISSTDTVLYTLRASVLDTYQTYGYPGEIIPYHFTVDTSSGWEVLGTVQSGAPNCIRMQLDSGSITLHSNPLQLTNFFLLHKDNHRYWSDLLSGLPHSYSFIWWDDYFRTPKTETDNFSSMGVFMKYPALKWALYTILLLLVVLLFSEIKRRRKIIPVLTPPENSSLDFVKTIGRLYYQHKDNSDLAIKMETHLMEFIRQHYHIQGNLPEDQLVRQLSLKSGVASELLTSLFYEFRMIEEHGTVSDEDLLRMNDLIEQFHIKRS
ncbi:DUF4350 domain-containing protein [Flavihumibacter sp. RY-1]|uniref:DUF4350 domain-containing protein n=1 Tax=Flavihumibacter fluminis TaxID=2909236 RepID=A0ABS9BCT1_9BACT|nr:DUF4350 domain-containing protein [Flavihumibacter fluminis]MCF1713487.1 DUF4350 domain-containing protein [Flavihumibacter fluminis]